MWFILTICEQCSSSNEGEITDLKVGEIVLEFEICSFFSRSKKQEKQPLREIENYISYRMCLANENFILVFDNTFF